MVAGASSEELTSNTRTWAEDTARLTLITGLLTSVDTHMGRKYLPEDSGFRGTEEEGPLVKTDGHGRTNFGKHFELGQTRQLFAEPAFEGDDDPLRSQVEEY